MSNWMYGFCETLRTSDLFTAGASTTTGVSGGAITAVCLQAGVSLSPDSEFQRALRAALKRKGSNTTLAIRDALDAALPSDVATRIGGRARIAIVRADGTAWRTRQPRLFETFEDKADVIGAVCASAHLPYLMNGEATATWRGKAYQDAACFGYLTMPVQGAVHVAVVPPRGFTPPGEDAPGLDFLGHRILNSRGQAPSDAHPWLADEADLRSELPTGFFGQVADLIGVARRRGAGKQRYEMGKEAFGMWSRRELALRA